MQIKMKQTSETDHEFVENGHVLETPSIALLPTNSEVICRPCQIHLIFLSEYILILWSKALVGYRCN
jgi:hypothetical protein